MSDARQRYSRAQLTASKQHGFRTASIRGQVRIRGVYLRCLRFDQGRQDQSIGHAETVAVRDARCLPKPGRSVEPNNPADKKNLLEESVRRRPCERPFEPELVDLYREMQLITATISRRATRSHTCRAR